ncbi:MAG: hypothetical protein ACMUIG_03910 [Thermoplasmatota archaeon]
MPRSEDIRGIIVEALDREDALREKAYLASRELIRECRNHISNSVRTETPEPLDDILLISDKLSDLRKEGDTARYHFIDDAYVELAEACILSRLLKDGKIPDPREISIPHRDYLLGLCDVAGELRRIVLNNILKGDLQRGREIFERMIEISDIIDGLVYPSGMIPIKKKQDQIRSMVDRTAGELSISLSARGIQKERGTR